MEKLAIGIDIGGTRTKIGLVNLESGKVLSLQIMPTETVNEKRFMGHIGTAIDLIRSKIDYKTGSLLGVGIGVPGFTFADGTVDTTYGFLKFMEDYPLTAQIEHNFGLRCLADNDARVVALGEARFGKGNGFGRVLVLTLGTGLGIGFVKNGQFDGALPYAHMAGHIAITDSDNICYCGKKGCLESLVSSAGILRIAALYGFSSDDQQLPLTAETVFNACANGNLCAAEIIDEYLRYLKTGISNYVNIYAPDIIVLGGGVAKGVAGKTDKLYPVNLQNPYKSYRVSIVVSELGEEAGVLGGAALFYNPDQQRLPVGPNLSQTK